VSTVRPSRSRGKPERAEVVTGVGVLDKCVTILAAVHASGALSLADLVEATGYSRATAHRLASALEDHRILRRDARGRWILGLRLFEWGSAAVGETGLVDVAGPVLADLRERCGASAQLYVRDGDHRVCIASAEPRTGLRDTVPVGAPLPLDRGSGGKVLLAWADDGADFGVDPVVLAAVRKRGWAESVSEREVGVASVSAPVRDRDGAVRAAVSVSGPIERMGRKPGDQFARAVLLAALAIERGLGGPQPRPVRARKK
jgi:DNA-binding IclR family transcriptional regulator